MRNSGWHVEDTRLVIFFGFSIQKTLVKIMNKYLSSALKITVVQWSLTITTAFVIAK